MTAPSFGIQLSGPLVGATPDRGHFREVAVAAEAAAVPVIDELRGRIVELYVSLKPGIEPSDEIAAKVSKTIETVIGKIARPKNVWIVPDMPKTRSGKIMRRVVASVSNFADIGDVTTLANPEIVEEIRAEIETEVLPRVRGADPRRLAVSVRDGVVSVSGRVQARSAVARLVAAVLAVEGVVGVDERPGFDLDDRYPPVPVTL